MIISLWLLLLPLALAEDYEIIRNEFKGLYEETRKEIASLKSIPIQLREVLPPCTLEDLDGPNVDIDFYLSCIPKNLEVNEGKPSFTSQTYIGEGAQGFLHSVTDDEGNKYALKSLISSDPLTVKEILHAAIVLKDIQDPSIISIKSVWLEQQKAPAAYYNIWTLQPLIEGGNVHQILQYYREMGNKPDGDPLVPGEAILAIAVSILENLSILHENKIIHLDVKPENMMASNDGSLVALIDYDYASIAGKPSQMGTMMYKAPEQLDDKYVAAYCSDMFALGITLFELATGVNPLDSDSGENREAKVGLNILRFRIENHYSTLPKNLEGKECFQLREDLKAASYKKEHLAGLAKNCPLSYTIYMCLQKDPADRPRAIDLLKVWQGRPRGAIPTNIPGYAKDLYLIFNGHADIQFYPEYFQPINVVKGLLYDLSEDVALWIVDLHKIKEVPGIPKLLSSGLYFEDDGKPKLHVEIDQAVGKTLSQLWIEDQDSVDLTHLLLNLLDILDNMAKHRLVLMNITPDNLVLDYEHGWTYNYFNSLHRLDQGSDGYQFKFAEAAYFLSPECLESGKFKPRDDLWSLAMSISWLYDPNVVHSPGLIEDADYWDSLEGISDEMKHFIQGMFFTETAFPDYDKLLMNVPAEGPVTSSQDTSIQDTSEYSFSEDDILSDQEE